jgi:fumarate hydratase subunit alpha
MKTIPHSLLIEKIRDLCIAAACELPKDVLDALKGSVKTEKSEYGRTILERCVENAGLARSEHLPICQDTGFAIFFISMGTDVRIDHGTVIEAVEEGCRQGYKEGYLRKSIVRDPLFVRENTGDNTPAIVHCEIVPGDTLTIHLLPKGGGSENVSALAMLKPSDGRDGVVRFVCETVEKAGANPCPPVIVGVGIGGTADYAMFLSKKALLRKTGTSHTDRQYAELENEIFTKLNGSGIGPQGLGGSTTALAVHIESFPCHIASLPVAVSINCHAARHATLVL